MLLEWDFQAIFHAILLPVCCLLILKDHWAACLSEGTCWGCSQDFVLHMVPGKPDYLPRMQAACNRFVLCLQGHHHAGSAGKTGTHQGTDSGYNQGTGNTGYQQVSHWPIRCTAWAL